MAQAQANGITIEYEERGDGEPLLLVMGLGGQLVDWPEGFVDLLVEQGFRVIQFDNRDSGLSTEFDWEPPTVARMAALMAARRRPKAGYLLRHMADDAVGLLDVLGIDSAHVLGMSMGGMIAQSVAIHHPSRTRSLTSVMSNTGDRRRGGVEARLLAKIARMPPPTPETAVDRSVAMFTLISGPEFDVDEFRPRAERAVARSFRPMGTARQMTSIMASLNRTGALRHVTAPTLVIHGLVDPLVKPSGGIATAKAVPGSRLLMFPDMGHDLPQKRWPEMVDAIGRNAARATPRQQSTGVTV